jgi:hypothetical protein
MADKNPILDLLIDEDALRELAEKRDNNPLQTLLSHIASILVESPSPYLSHEISDAKWEAFEAIVSETAEEVDAQERENAINKQDPPLLEQRSALMHLWKQHVNGYLPIAEFVFLSDGDLALAHKMVIAQAYKDINPILKIANNYKQTSQVSNAELLYEAIRTNKDVSSCALLYEMIPEVTKFLQDTTISAEKLNTSLRTIFDAFSKKLEIFKDKTLANSALSNMLWKNTMLVKDISGKSTTEYAEYSFGDANDKERIEALALVEACTRCVVLESPLQENVPDERMRQYAQHQQYGSEAKDPIAAKIALYVQSVELVRTARDVIRLQDGLLNSSDPALQKLATISNDTFTVAAFQKFLDAQDKAR